MPNITADLVVNHNLYANSAIKGYAGDFKTVKKNIAPGGLIGNVYSWYVDPSGVVWWMFYDSPQAYRNMDPFYVKHEEGKISFPDKPDIMAKLEAEQRQMQIDQKGVTGYYVEKYAPILIGGVLLIGALPTLLNHSKVSGMTSKKNETAILLIGSALAIYFLTRDKKPKLKGSVIVDPLDPGEYLPNYDGASGTPQSDAIKSQNVASVPGSNQIEYIGIFPVTYLQQSPAPAIAGKGFGKRKIF